MKAEVWVTPWAKGTHSRSGPGGRRTDPHPRIYSGASWRERSTFSNRAPMLVVPTTTSRFRRYDGFSFRGLDIISITYTTRWRGES